MKRMFIVIGLAAGLLAQIIHAQGTVYLSNLGDPSSGSAAVASDSWLALDFETGNSIGGYSLDSVQLAMTDASGSPNGFSIMLYAQNFGIQGATLPGSSLGTLEGSVNPSTAGIYTYTPTIATVLTANSVYFIVLTAGTAVASGAYGWSESTSYPIQNNDLRGGGGIFYSSNGLNWPSIIAAYPQFAITATAIPEPSSGLFLLLGGVLFYVRRTFRPYAS